MEPAELEKPPSLNDSATTSQVARSPRGLTSRHIGLQLKDGAKLIITLDTIVALDPLAFELQGFSVAFDLFTLKTPQTVMKMATTFSLAGISTAYSKPPATLAGMVVRNTPSRSRGAMELGVGKWTFLAGGVYAEKKTKGYKSVFVSVFFVGLSCRQGSRR